MHANTWSYDMGIRTSESSAIVVIVIGMVAAFAVLIVVLTICISMCQARRDLNTIHALPEESQIRQWMRRVSATASTTPEQSYLSSRSCTQRNSCSTEASAADNVTTIQEI
jgi:hypothetical protein